MQDLLSSLDKAVEEKHITKTPEYRKFKKLFKKVVKTPPLRKRKEA